MQKLPRLPRLCESTAGTVAMTGNRCVSHMSRLSVIHKIVILFGFLLMAYFLVYFYRFTEESYSRAQEQSRSGTTILQKLGKHMILPSVQPTIATVVDPNPLKQKSSFFSKAKKGDSIIIYPDKVIIFDANTEKIVDIGLNNKKNNSASESENQ